MSRRKLDELLSIQTLNEPLYDPFTVSVNKCDGSWNSINDPYAQVCVPNKAKKYECKSI